MSKTFRPHHPADAASPYRTQSGDELARIEGQVRGIRRMFETDAATDDKIKRINAVILALRANALRTVSRDVQARISRALGEAGTLDDVAELYELVRVSFHLPEND